MTASPAPVVVRRADGNDLHAVVEVGRRSVLSAFTTFYDREVVDLLLAKWWTKDANIPSIRAGRTFVAEFDGRVVGMASHGAHDGRQVIWKLYVDPDHQGRGAGARLVQTVCHEIAPWYDCVYLTVNDGNDAAYGFALGHGFVEERREKEANMPDLIWLRRPTALQDSRNEVDPTADPTGDAPGAMRTS